MTYVTRRNLTVWPSVTLLLKLCLYTKLVDQLAFLKSHINWNGIMMQAIMGARRQLERYQVTTKKLVSSWG